ncbi:MAG: signal recognition particle-docking protein FtsY [Methylococcales bacterium]|nr:signal recognition particle-docking protein FtsY [Methylococcales bacterium]
MFKILVFILLLLTVGQAAVYDWPMLLLPLPAAATDTVPAFLNQHGLRLILVVLAWAMMLLSWIAKKAPLGLRLQAMFYFNVQLALLGLAVFYPSLGVGLVLYSGLNWLLELSGFVLALSLFWHLRHGWQKRPASLMPSVMLGVALVATLLASLFGQWLSLPGYLPHWPSHYPLTLPMPDIMIWLTALGDWLLIETDTPTQALFAAQQLSMLVADVSIFCLALWALIQRHTPLLRGHAMWLLVLWLVQLGVSVALLQQSALLALSSWWQYSAFLLLPPLLGLGKERRYQRLRRVVETSASPDQTAEPAATPVDLLGRLQTQLGKTRGGLTGWLNDFAGAEASLDVILEQVESQLLMADVGITTTTTILEKLSTRLAGQTTVERAQLSRLLQEELTALLAPLSQPLVIDRQQRPFVILVVGVNGAGKTTTIGKLAKRLSHQGLNVMLAAGDTFRAAAVEQLQVWGERNHVPVVAQATGADSASVIFDALQSAQNKQVDVLIADTAGRLHTKSNLMEELKKVKRIMAKLDPGAPHEVLLVLDAGIGQNGLAQAKQFHDSMGVTGLALTKLDGTAKGGVIFALADQLKLPIRLIGVGEGIEDLQDFNAEHFITALFQQAP